MYLAIYISFSAAKSALFETATRCPGNNELEAREILVVDQVVKCNQLCFY